MDWQSFNPGYWEQDLFTFPLEVGVIAVANEFYTPRARPLWPFDTEDESLATRSTTFPRSVLLPIGLGVSSLILGGLSFSNNNFSLGVQTRGWIHAVLLTEVATTSTKLTFQRARPNSSEDEGGDARMSFFSGHASHMFSFATYSSLLMFYYAQSPILSTAYALGIYSFAAWVATSRVQDHAHYTSDVIVGGLVGSAISAAVFYRVREVEKNLNSKSEPGTLAFLPRIFFDEEGKTWYAASVEMQL